MDKTPERIYAITLLALLLDLLLTEKDWDLTRRVRRAALSQINRTFHVLFAAHHLNQVVDSQLG